MTRTNKSESQFVWTKFILLFGGLVAIPSFIYLVWWSFGETFEWFGFLDFSTTVANKNPSDFVPLALALVFQFGQGPVLYLRMVFKTRYRRLSESLGRSHNTDIEHEANSAYWSMFAAGCVFIVFAVIDGWTNIDQMWSGLRAREAMGAIVGVDKYIFSAAIGIVMVMIEELLGLVISMTSNVYNDIREVYGYRRIAWLDMFGRIAEQGLSGHTSQPRQTSYRPFPAPAPKPHSINGDRFRQKGAEQIYPPTEYDTAPWERGGQN